MLTDHVKENYIYRLLDEQRMLPHINHLMQVAEEQESLLQHPLNAEEPRHV